MFITNFPVGPLWLYRTCCSSLSVWFSFILLSKENKLPLFTILAIYIIKELVYLSCFLKSVFGVQGRTLTLKEE